MEHILQLVWEMLVGYVQWETTHWLKTKYVVAFLLFGWCFIKPGLSLLPLIPSLVMPHIIELGDISAEVKRRADKEFEEVTKNIDKEALK